MAVDSRVPLDGHIIKLRRRWRKKAPQKSLLTSKYCPFFFTIYSNFRHFFFFALDVCFLKNTICNALSPRDPYSRIRTPTYFWLGNKVRSVIMHSRPFLILCCERWHVRRCWIYGAQCFFSGVKNNWLRCIFSTLKAFSRLGKLNHTGHLSSVSSETSRFLHFLSKQLALQALETFPLKDQILTNPKVTDLQNFCRKLHFLSTFDFCCMT